MAKRRKMSAKQRRFFGKRKSVRRSSHRSSGFARRKRSGGSRSGFGGLLPISLKEGAVDFGTGLALPWVSSQVAKITPLENALANLGDYNDEARTAIIGAVAYKFGGMLHPLVKEAGRSAFKYATVSAGIQTAGNWNIGTSNSASNGVVYA